MNGSSRHSSQVKDDFPTVHKAEAPERSAFDLDDKGPPAFFPNQDVDDKDSF